MGAEMPGLEGQGKAWNMIACRTESESAALEAYFAHDCGECAASRAWRSGRGSGPKPRCGEKTRLAMVYHDEWRKARRGPMGDGMCDGCRRALGPTVFSGNGMYYCIDCATMGDDRHDVSLEYMGRRMTMSVARGLRLHRSLGSPVESHPPATSGDFGF